MPRTGVTAGVAAELGLAANQPIHLYEATFENGTVYLTDAPFTISWNGNEYGAAGQALGFADVAESAALRLNSIQVRLSGVDQSFIGILLNEDYVGRQIVIRKALLSGGGVMVDPFPIFDGFMDGVSIQEGISDGSCVLAVSASTHWGDVPRNGRHTNHEEQQIHFPGDMGFEFVSEINKDIMWGRGPITPTQQSAPPPQVSWGSGGTDAFSPENWGGYQTGN